MGLMSFRFLLIYRFPIHLSFFLFLEIFVKQTELLAYRVPHSLDFADYIFVGYFYLFFFFYC